MSRKRVIVDSKSRSFILPAALLVLIERAAEKRKIEASAVVRELLDSNILEYVEKSEPIWRDLSRKAIEAVKKDPDVLPLFEKWKGRKQLVLPLDTGLNKSQVSVLKEALEAYRDLQ